MEIWNCRKLKPPPVCTFPAVPDDLAWDVVRTVKENLTRYSGLLEKEASSESEKFILTRIIYQHRNQMRMEKWFSILRKISHFMRRGDEMELTETIKDFAASLPSFDEKEERKSVYLPSRQLAEYLCVRFLGLSALLHQTAVACVNLYSLLLEQIHLGTLILRMLFIIALVSRIWALCRARILHLSTSYRKILKLLPELQETRVPLLPEGWKLPVDLTTWLEETLGPEPMHNKESLAHLFNVTDEARNTIDKYIQNLQGNDDTLPEPDLSFCDSTATAEEMEKDVVSSIVPSLDDLGVSIKRMKAPMPECEDAKIFQTNNTNRQDQDKTKVRKVHKKKKKPSKLKEAEDHSDSAIDDRTPLSNKKKRKKRQDIENSGFAKDVCDNSPCVDLNESVRQVNCDVKNLDKPIVLNKKRKRDVNGNEKVIKIKKSNSGNWSVINQKTNKKKSAKIKLESSDLTDTSGIETSASFLDDTALTPEIPKSDKRMRKKAKKSIAKTLRQHFTDRKHVKRLQKEVQTTRQLHVSGIGALHLTDEQSNKISKMCRTSIKPAKSAREAGLVQGKGKVLKYVMKIWGSKHTL